MVWVAGHAQVSLKGVMGKLYFIAGQNITGVL